MSKKLNLSKKGQRLGASIAGAVTYQTTIDSFKIRIALEEVEILEPKINDHFEVTILSGEIKPDEFKRGAHKVDDGGIKTKYMIKRVMGKGQKMQEYLIILVNAKALKRYYLEGINPETVVNLYHYLQLQKAVKFSFDTFVKSPITDCDIKQDYQVKDRAAQNDIIQTMQSLTRMSQKVSEGAHTFDTKANLGISWNKRETATNSKSYVKIYAKDVELYNNPSSRDFFINHFGQKIPPTMRLECTIKNQKHFDYLRERAEHKARPLEMNLDNLLTYGYLDNLLAIMLKQNIEKQVEKLEELPTTDFGTSDLLAFVLIQSCRSVIAAEMLIDRWESNKHKRYAAKKKIRSAARSLDFETSSRAQSTDDFLKRVLNPQDVIIQRNKHEYKTSKAGRPQSWKETIDPSQLK